MEVYHQCVPLFAPSEAHVVPCPPQSAESFQPFQESPYPPTDPPHREQPTVQSWYQKPSWYQDGPPTVQVSRPGYSRPSGAVLSHSFCVRHREASLAQSKSRPSTL